MNNASRTPTGTGKTVASVRTDGLGQRLRAILRAMHVARMLGVDYVFTWEGEKEALEHHAVPLAEDTFSEDYRRAHVVPAPLSSHVEVQTPVDDLDGLRRLADGAGGWIVRKGAALRGMSTEQETPPGYYRALFDEIDFQPAIRTAIAAADQTPLPAEAAAIHLRAGDIIYGRFRFSNRFTDKVIALPVARKMIEKLTSEGRTIVLFSQDPTTADLFRGRSDVVIASDLAARFETRIEKALFEIVLMSRCEQIHAGSSAFALLAGVLADCRVQDPSDFFTRSKQVKVIVRDLVRLGNADAYPPLQTAFAAWVAAGMTKDPKEASRMLALAVRYDPANGYYWLKLAALHYAHGRDAQGDAVVRDMLNRSGPEADEARAVAIHAYNERPRGVSYMAAEQAVFVEAAARGSELARYLAAHIRDPRSPNPITAWAPLEPAA